MMRYANDRGSRTFRNVSTLYWTTQHHVPEDTKCSHTVSLAQYSKYKLFIFLLSISRTCFYIQSAHYYNMLLQCVLTPFFLITK